MSEEQAESWETRTPPASLAAIQARLDENTARCNAAADWSFKAYEMCKPVVEGMAAAQTAAHAAHRNSSWAVLASAFAVLAAFAGLACELVR